MKKTIKKLSVAIIVCILISALAFTVFAETIYDYYELEYIIIDNASVSIYGCSEGTTSVSIPSVINGRNVIGVSNRAFLNNTEITRVDFSKANNLQTIGMFAFSGCTNLNNTVTIPANVTRIDTAAFQDCTSITDVVVNATITNLPGQCFNRCTSLSSVLLSDTITSIGNFAFADCPNLSYIEIPSSVTSIANSAFMNDTITLGVYYNSYAHQYAESRGIDYIILDPENIPTEPPTEAPTDEPTEAPTQEPTSEPTDAPTEAKGYYLGDVDNDGDVEVIDATLIQRYNALIETGLPESQLMQGDVDGDGDVSLIDTTYVLRYTVLMDVPYPIGEWIET